jgi:hypothetical protein
LRHGKSTCTLPRWLIYDSSTTQCTTNSTSHWWSSGAEVSRAIGWRTLLWTQRLCQMRLSSQIRQGRCAPLSIDQLWWDALLLWLGTKNVAMT